MADLVELHLRTPGTEPPDDPGCKPLVLRLLGMICDTAPEDESAETAGLRALLLAHRQRLAAPLHPQEARQEAAACASACERYLRRVQQDRTARERELTDLIALLRDAASRLVGDSSDFRAEVLSSADRFKAMTRLDDIRELKRELSSEIARLQQAVDEKKERDQRAIDRLSKRIELLQSDLGRAEEKASLDPLTRAANRGSLDRTLVRLIAAARAADTPLSLAMIDIDHFKQINDTYGHQLGDRVLLCVAEALRAAVRPTDIVARYGGDELAVVLPGMSLHQAADRVEHVLRELAGRSHEYDDAGRTGAIRFTASCGVSQLAAGDTDKDLIHRADQALYEAKRKGRNRVIARKHSRLARLLSR